MSATQCTAHARTGARCKRSAIPGGTVCRYHGGASGHVRRAAKRRLALAEAHAELVKLGHPIEVDPAVAMLEMVYEAAGNVAVLRRLVQELRHEVSRDAAEDWVAHERGEPGQSMAIAGLVGSESKPGEAAVHIWVAMYDAERDRLMRWSKMCRDAGVDERRVELAEAQALLLVGVIRTVTDGLRAALAGAGLEGEVLDVVFREQLPSLARAALEATSRSDGGGGAG